MDRYIRNAWYNWAVTSMKAGNNRDVLEKIDEALGIDPSDAEAIKIRKFAERYSARARDQVYLSFANDHALRAIDH